MFEGITFFTVTGVTNQTKRADVLKSFQDYEGPCVLILSSVGGAGLNIAQANHIIIMVTSNLLCQAHIQLSKF